ISVHNAEGRELERHNVVIGSMISVPNGAHVKGPKIDAHGKIVRDKNGKPEVEGQVLVQWDPYNIPILTDKGGKIEFRDMIAGVTIKRDVDEATGLMGTVIIEHKEDLHPQIVIMGDKKEVLASYSIPAGAHVIVEEDQKIRAGALLAKTPRKVANTKDIIAFKGDFVKKGQQLTEGPIVPHEILEVCGPQELQEHLVNEVQEVYRLQGVEINDKHIEIIVRQMLRKVKITDPGDTSLL